MRFQVYKDGNLAKSFDFDGTYVFDNEGAALGVTDSLSFSNGEIRFDLLSYETGGLNVMWKVEGIGNLNLCTTKLRKRSEPYILNLELARARLMQITLKREDWGLFDEQDDHTHKAIASAEKYFVSALSNVNNPSKCSLFADKCLKKALLASENLAQRQAEVNMLKKKNENTLKSITTGCNVQVELIDKPVYVKNITTAFDKVVIPVCWADIEKEKGTYDFAAFDKCIAALSGKGVTLSAGPILRFEKNFYPDWAIGYNYEGIKELAYNLITEVVKRYANKIDTWILLSGMNSCNDLKFAFDDCIEICRAVCLAARAADPLVTKVIALDKPWAWYHSKNVCTIPTVQFAETLVQNAIGFDKVGIDLDFSGSNPDSCTRDLMQISSMIDRLSISSRPITITSIKVPSEQNGCKGFWRDNWSENTQSVFLKALYKILIGKTQIDSISYGNFVDNSQSTGLLRLSGEPKASFKTIRSIKNFLNE